MTANKISLLLLFILILFSCQRQTKTELNSDGVEIMNLIIQTIHSEVNVTSCFRKEVTTDCQCQEAFSYSADSIILFDRVTESELAENMKEKGCELIPISSYHFQNITYYKKVSLMAPESFDRQNQLPRTAYVVINLVWQCQDQYFVHVGYIVQKAFSGHLLTFSKDANGSLFLEDIELMGYS